MAGFICGYALALAATPLLALALVRARATNTTVQGVVPEATPMFAVAMLLHTGAFLVFTAIGLVLGILLSALEENAPAGGLGSPNRVFTLLVLATVAIAVLPMAAVLPGRRRELIGGGLIVAGLFGWFMPYLASWAPADD
jgi:hypothetical protein